MADAEPDFMPYAPAEPVLRIIHRFRERGLPDPINRRTLPQIGVAEGNADRIERTLAFLGLIDEQGRRTADLDHLGKAPSEEYPRVLGEIVKRAYAPVLTIVNPETDGPAALQDAFRPYQPAGQRARMVSLFLGLCKEAELVSGGAVKRPPRSKRPSAGPKVNARSGNGERPAPGAQAPKTPASAGHDGGHVEHADEARHDGTTLDLRLVSGLIQQLPRDGKWTELRRKRWLEAVTATIDLLIEVESPQTES